MGRDMGETSMLRKRCDGAGARRVTRTGRMPVSRAGIGEFSRIKKRLLPLPGALRARVVPARSARQGHGEKG